MEEYQIQEFRGIDQSISQNIMNQSYSPDACNMDTENGDLAVGKGFVKHIGTTIPGTDTIWRMYLWHKGTADHFIVAAGNKLYHYVQANGDTASEWEIIYTYSGTINSRTWDFQEARIGTSDYLIIANGQAQLVKWGGSGTAEVFGSGEYVFESTVASVGYNLTKATAVSYDEKQGIYTLTMPDGWTYAEGKKIAFLVAVAVTDATTVRVDIGGNLYTLSEKPTWEVGNMARITLTSDTTATWDVVTKPLAVAYAESETIGTYTVTMDEGWAYAENAEIAFVVGNIKTDETITSTKIVIGTSTYTMTAEPQWALEKIAVVKLVSATGCTSMEADTPSEVTYADKNGLYQLTMPDGWAYVQNAELAFDVPSTIGLVGCILISIGSGTYKLNYIPGWVGGDTAALKLTGEKTAVVSLTEYGITSVVLENAISEEWKQRGINVGMQIKDITREVSAISDDRLTLALKSPCMTAITAGDTAKIRGGVSDLHVNYVEMHYSRLFSAGNHDYPSRLYWSQPPGDIRTIEDWSMDDASDIASGGHTEVGNTSSEPIVGLCSLSNQLLIFKESSVYRLLGSSPQDYRVVQVNLKTERMVNSGLVKFGDVPFWLTRAGMFYHDGQQAKQMGTARQIRYILQGADLTACKAIENRDRMYFTCNRSGGDYDDSIIVYDMVYRTYMLRNGFHVIDICSHDGTMYMINEGRHVYRMWEGNSYDGSPINAYWTTPKTDFSAKGVDKQLRKLYLRGEGNAILLTARIGTHEQQKRYVIPKDEEEVLDIALRNMGRTLQLTIKNENGSYFRLTGGIEVLYDAGRI